MRRLFSTFGLSKRNRLFCLVIFQNYQLLKMFGFTFRISSGIGYNRQIDSAKEKVATP